MSDEKKRIAVQVLFIDRSENSAEEKVSTLRNAGIAIHPQVVSSARDLEEGAHAPTPDLILYASPGGDLDLATAARRCRDRYPGSPMVALAGKQDHDTLIEALRQGVRDIVFSDDPEHLVIVVKRELEDLRSRRSVARLEENLKESEQRCAALMKSSRDAIVYVHDGMHVYGNPAYLEMFGYVDMEEIEGLPILEMIAPEEQAGFRQFLKTRGSESAELEIGCRNSRGKVFKSRLEFSPASIEGEPCTQIIFRIQRENRELEQALERLRSRDSGTGLFNRDYFISGLQEMLDEREGTKGHAALFYLSLDGFHEIRSRIGLSSSDKLLHEIAHVIAGNVDDADLLARFGDHSFTLMANREERSALKVVAENLLKAVRGHLFQADRDLVEPTCSIGIAYLDERVVGAQDLLNNADYACRVSSEAGGDRITPFDPVKMGTRVGGSGGVGETRMGELIRHALSNDRFKLVYQPIVSLQGESAENYAVLVRLLDHDDSEILPNYFLQYLREENLESRFDRWVTERALAELRRHRGDERKTRFFINLCGATLEDDQFLIWLCESLQKSGVEGAWVTFQAPEGELRARMQAAQAFYGELKKTGAEVAISQFGRHPKPETLLKHIPFDWVKFDASLVSEVTKDQHIQDRVSALNKEVQEKGAKSIAVGVEDANTLAALWNLGLNSVQGYFLQEPSEEISLDAQEGVAAFVEP